MLSDSHYGHAPVDGRHDSLREGRADARFAARADARAIFVCSHCSCIETGGERLEMPVYQARLAT